MDEIFETLTFNVIGKAKVKKLHGREHFVVPTVMLMEGVFNGSDGSILYEEPDLEESTSAWNHKPLVVYHPKQKKSACTPEVLDKQGCGVILNTEWNTKSKKLRNESWFDIEKTAAVDERVVDNIRNGRMMEVSTGLHLRILKESGVWNNGRKFSGKAKKLRPDHLAILPDQEGACSIQDGAGLFQFNSATLTKEQISSFEASLQLLLNSKDASFSDIERRVRKVLAKEYGSPGQDWMGFIEAMFPDYVIYYEDGKLFKVDYTVAKDGTVSLDGEPVEVRRATTYQVLNGAVADTVSKNSSKPPVEEQMMDKKAFIDELIANSGGQWTEEDRASLDAMPEKQLKKLKVEKPKEDPAKVVKNAKTDDKELLAGFNSQQQTVNNTTQTVKKPTLQEHLENLPPEVRSLVSNMLKRDEAEKKTLVAALVANKNNTFSEEYLLTKSTEELQGLVALASPSQSDENQAAFSNGIPMFRGAAGAPPINNSKPITQKTLEPLDIDWDKK